MTRRQRTLYRLGKLFRRVAATLIVAAGIYYLIAPPVTTTKFFDATWPPLAWGAVMVVGGIVMLGGQKTRIMQVEQLGTMTVAFALGMLALAQTLVMVEYPITHTRGGGTLVLWAFTLVFLARAFDLSAEIRSAKLAQSMTRG